MVKKTTPICKCTSVTGPGHVCKLSSTQLLTSHVCSQDSIVNSIHKKSEYSTSKRTRKRYGKYKLSNYIKILLYCKIYIVHTICLKNPISHSIYVGLRYFSRVVQLYWQSPAKVSFPNTLESIYKLNILFPWIQHSNGIITIIELLLFFSTSIQNHLHRPLKVYTYSSQILDM